MAKEKKQEKTHAAYYTEGQRCVVKDTVGKSKAFVPIQVDLGNSIEVVQVEGGLIKGLQKGEAVCDNLVYTLEESKAGLNITWVIELKGTKNEKEAKHAIEQIAKSIQYMQDQASYPKAGKYIKNRDFVFAAVAGAPDKTLPALNNDELKALCKKLKAISGRRKDVKDMFMLFCYVRPNARCKKAEIKGNKPPYDILCYHSQEGYIPFPSMLMKLLEGNSGS